LPKKSIIKVVNVLEDASEKQVPIMVFVGNRGIIQIHTGEVKNALASAMVQCDGSGF
jgi:putative heme degradation protein